MTGPHWSDNLTEREMKATVTIARIVVTAGLIALALLIAVGIVVATLVAFR